MRRCWIELLALQGQLAQHWKPDGDCIHSSFDMLVAATLRTLSAPPCRETEPTACTSSCEMGQLHIHFDHMLKRTLAQ